MDNKKTSITSFDDAFIKPKTTNHSNNQIEKSSIEMQKNISQTGQVQEAKPIANENIAITRPKTIPLPGTEYIAKNNSSDQIAENQTIFKNQDIVTAKVEQDLEHHESSDISKNSEDEVSNTSATKKVENDNGTTPTSKKPEEKPVLNNESDDEKSWIRPKSYISSSLKTLIPGSIIAVLAFGTANVIPTDVLINLLFDPEVMATQPDFLKDNLPIVLKSSLYIFALLGLYISYISKNQGRLYIYDNYLLHKVGMFRKPVKILIPEIVAIDIHWTPFSLLKEVGSIEVSSLKKDILFKNCPNPNAVKQLIENKQLSFKGV